MTAAALLILVGVGLLIRAAAPIVTTADIAVIELYTDLASHAQLLVGPYSRFGWHHPGPLYFYLQAPLYVLSGRTGVALYAGAAIINVVALAVLLWTIAQQQRPVLAAGVGAMLMVFAIRVPRFLASPWTAHVTILPALAGIALAAAVASGQTQLLALTAFVISFVVQTDLAFVPPMLAIVGLTLVAVACQVQRGRKAPMRDLSVAGGVSIVVWFFPIFEALRHDGGNLAALWRFFTGPAGQLPSASDAFGAWSGGVAGIIRPDVTLAWGGHPGQSATWVLAVAVALLLWLATTTVQAGRARRTFDQWLGAMTLTTMLAGLWALTHVRGDILDHEVFWLVGVGALAVGLVIVPIVERAIAPLPSAGRVARRTSAMVILAALVLAVVQFRDFVGFERRLPGASEVPPAVAAIEAYLDHRHAAATMVEVDTAWAQAVPIVLRLRQNRRQVTVAPANLFMFTDALAPTGREDSVLKVQAGRRAAPDSGWQLVFDSFSVSVYASR